MISDHDLDAGSDGERLPQFDAWRGLRQAFAVGFGRSCRNTDFAVFSSTVPRQQLHEECIELPCSFFETVEKDFLADEPVQLTAGDGIEIAGFVLAE